MALAGRPSRSGGGRRLLIVVLLLTILVVLLDASIKSRSPAPAETLTAETWVDRALPYVAASSIEGRRLDALRSSGLGMSATAITGTLDSVASDAAGTYRAVLDLGQPEALGGAPGLLEASLLARSKASAAMASSVTAALSGSAPPASTSDVVVTGAASAADQLQVADAAYGLFAGAVPRSLGVTFPASVWVSDASLFTPTALQLWLASLRSGTSLAPVHQLAIDAVSTNPPPVGTEAGSSVQELAPTQAISVSIVVADTGNQDEPDLTVTASLSASARGAYPLVRGFTSLTPGTAQALTIGPLVPPAGTAVTLTVTVTPLRGSPTPPATRTISLEVAAPPTTTTTTPPTTSVPPTTSGG